MKKIIIVLFVLLLIPCFAWFKKEKPILILSSNEIDIEKKQSDNIFRVGDRIYFWVYTKDGFKSDYIKYQVVKQDDKAHIGGYSRIANKTKRVSDKNSFIDYLVINSKGKYFFANF